MGCDIHAFVEEKEGIIYCCKAELFINRNYQLFALLADVRNSTGNAKPLIPISEPKGLPNELGWRVINAYEKWQEDAHSETYLNYEEISEAYISAWLDETISDDTRKQLLILQHTMSRMNEPRLILWFDN